MTVGDIHEPHADLPHRIGISVAGTLVDNIDVVRKVVEAMDLKKLATLK
jgi:hypothetical protein